MPILPSNENLAVIRQRQKRLCLLGFISIIILISVGWVWRTISFKKDLANVLAKSVERDLQFGDLRNAIMNLERSGAPLFLEIQFLDQGPIQRSDYSADLRSEEKLTGTLQPRFSINGGTNVYTRSRLLAYLHTHFLTTAWQIPIQSPSVNGLSARLQFRINPFEGLGIALSIFTPIVLLFILIAFKRSMNRLKTELDVFAMRQSAEAKSTIATQVAHDIRSPLTALNMIMKSADALPADHRLIIRNATQRINDIANELLQQGKDAAAQATTINIQASDSANTLPEPISLVPILESVISELQMRFSEDPTLEIRGDFRNQAGPNDVICASVNATELARVIANLVNNSSEASIAPERVTQVTIALRSSKDSCTIYVSDDGKGIPPEILVQLGQKGVTYEKTGTQSGSGFGLYHARETIEKANGKFTIQSQVGVGTIVTMTLPRATAL